MKRIGTGIAMLALAAAPLAAAHAANKVEVDASMLVTGTISVSPKGMETGYQLDKPDKLPPAVVDMLSRSIPHWRFKPVMRHGRAVAANARMTLRILAKPIGGKRYELSLEGSEFGNPDSALSLRERHIKPPTYPTDARRYDVGGTVYLLMLVNRKGRVVHVSPMQVNLQVRGTPNEMTRWRHELAQASVDAARHWTFEVPDKGPEASQKYWYACVPTVFRITSTVDYRALRHGYGVWEPYIPGPREPIPWLPRQQVASGPVDAQVPGTLYTGRQGLQRIGSPKG